MYHLTFQVQGRFQAFRNEAELRLAARSIARVGGDRLLAWALPGDHLHTVLDGPRVAVGPLGRDLRFALRALGTVLVEPHYREITSRYDLEGVVAYVLRQASKHECCDRPALFSGSCFPDLVGARVLDGWSADPLRAHLPRLDLARYLPDVAARSLPEPVTDAGIRALGASRLAAAAAAAHATPYPLTGNGAPAVHARRTAAVLGEAAGFHRSELAFALGTTVQAAGRLARSPRDPRSERAVRLRLGLEDVAMRIERPLERAPQARYG